MSEQERLAKRAVQGTIHRRLLINAVVDPDEVAQRLPASVRPHVTAQGTVVGCCLLEIEAIRPAGLPSAVGQRLRAVAHRISVEWDDESGTTAIGVYVPVRHTDSALGIALGGRWFPGVHKRARIEVSSSGPGLRWQCEPRRALDLAVRVEVSHLPAPHAGAPCDLVGATCLGADVGVSPDRHGRLEAARMQPAHRDARIVAIDVLESAFINGFSTATLSTSYLMCDADVTWTRAPAPATMRGGLSA